MTLTAGSSTDLRESLFFSLTIDDRRLGDFEGFFRGEVGSVVFPFFGVLVVVVPFFSASFFSCLDRLGRTKEDFRCCTKDHFKVIPDPTADKKHD